MLTCMPHQCKVAVATLHVGMTGKQDVGYMGLSSPGQDIIHSTVARVVCG